MVVVTVSVSVITRLLLLAKTQRNPQEKQSRPDYVGHGRQLDDTYQGMMAVLSKSKMEQDKTVFAWQTAHLDSGAIAPIVIDDFVLSMNTKASSGLIGTAARRL